MVVRRSACDAAYDPAGAVAVHACTVRAEEDWAVEPFSDRQVDGPGGAWCEWDDDDLAALAQHGQGAVTAFEAELVDVGAECFGDAQPVDRQQVEQGVLVRCPQAGGDEQRADLVAVQGDGVRLIVQPRPAYMDRGRVLEQLFLYGVAVEPGDCAQPSRDRRANSPARLHFTAEALDVRAASLEQAQTVLLTPRGEHAQVERVRVAGQPAVPGQRSALGVGEQRLDRHDDLGPRDGGGHERPPRSQAGTRPPRSVESSSRWMTPPGCAHLAPPNGAEAPTKLRPHEAEWLAISTAVRASRIA